MRAPRRQRTDSMHDRASVPGVGNSSRPNRKRKPTASVIAARKRLAARVGKISLGAVLCGLAAWGVVELRGRALTSPRFSIEAIEISGEGRATREAVEKLSGVSIGQNIFTVAPDEVARMVEAHPWVKRAEVSRRLPRTVAIELVEHEPALLVALGHLYYANRQGEIVKRYTPGEKEPLPIVTGLTREAVEADDASTKVRLLQAISFLDALRSSGVEGEVAEVHLDPALGLSFTLRGAEPTVVLGEAPFGPRIERWRAVRDALSKRGVRASRIMLGGARRPDRVVARLETAALGASPGRTREGSVGGRPALVSRE